MHTHRFSNRGYLRQLRANSGFVGWESRVPFLTGAMKLGLLTAPVL
jgi:hypothetical protein